MYNEHEKINFLLMKEEHPESVVSVDICMRTFNRIQKIEKKYGKDVTQFSPEEAQECVDSFNIYKNKKRKRLSYEALMEYVDWTIQENIFPKGINVNNFQNVVLEPGKAPKEETEDDLTLTKLKSRKNKAKFKKIIGRRDYQILKDNLSDRDKFILEMAYNGASYEEIFLAHIRDIDFENLTMTLYKTDDNMRAVYSREFKITKEIADLAKKANECYTFGRYKITGDNIVKWKKPEITQKRQLISRGTDFNQRIRDVLEELNIVDDAQKVSFPTSGMVYKIKMLSINEGISGRKAAQTPAGIHIMKDIYGYEFISKIDKSLFD